MHVLYFSPRICWPTISGAHLRDFYFARHLARHAQLTYVGLVNDDAGAQTEQLRARLGNGADVIAWRRERSYQPANILRGLVGPTPLNVLNFTSAAVASDLEQLLRTQTFDVAQIESMHLVAYARQIRLVAPRTRVILDWHNIESEILDRYAQQGRNPLRSWYAQRTSSLSHGVEAELLRLCHAHTVCSERERDVLLARVPEARIEVVGNGVDCAFFAGTPAESGERRDLLFMGRMDYHANIDAALYFTREVWPLVRKRRPELRLTIVGAEPPRVILALREQGITVTGTVEDVRPFYRSALVSVVPLRVGGGTRLKVLEAMAAGTPVVSTALGAEGLAITPGKDILIADTPETMADAIVSLRANTSVWQALTASGGDLVRAKYDWEVVGEALWRLHAEQVEKGTACLPAK
ncbi:MAG TPA: glycosyltransferase [Bryocella sp.]|nr:glycosyltransferase [Bryocella sp.]